MRTKLLKTTLQLSIFLLTLPSMAQVLRPDIQFFRYNDKRGLNVFENPKEDTVAFDGFKVRLGGDFAMQFQGLNQSNRADSLVELGTNFNLPTANLNLDVQLYDGLTMHLRTYLSSRNHEEAWVKGGHFRVDKLDFIKPGFASEIMDKVTVIIGLDEINYGDAHFRRSDNARGIFNPFVGNYLMDAFTVEAFGEVNFQMNGLIGVLGVSNGKINQRVVVNDNSDNQASFYGKLGIDRQIDEDLRVRLTGSWYTNNGTTSGLYLYGGDRAGARYYHVLETLEEDAARASNPFSGRFNPRFRQLTAFQINPFVKYKGLEFFGIYERAGNGDDEGDGAFTQLAGELAYRFGSTEQLYVGGRYNRVSGEMTETASTSEIDRLNFVAGWYLTRNVMAKFEYVTQEYSGDGWAGSKFEGGEFDGFVIEAVISF